MQTLIPRIVADFACECGENPLWHPTEKKLYWTDIPTGRLFRYDPATEQAEQIYEGRPVGGFTFQKDGSLLLFRDRGNVVVWRDGKEQRTIIDEIPEERDTRFNDVFADPESRVYGGTMPTDERKGRLYRIDRDGSYHVMLEGVGIPNGMSLTLDGKQLYFTDSLAHTIWLFDYDRKNGALTNQRAFLELDKSHGLPDGMTVDTADDIWTARFNGASVCHFKPDGTFIEKIDLPANQITSLIFAGEDLTDLYITSAGAHQKPDTGKHAGALFHVRTNVQGRPEHPSRIGGG